MFKVKPKTDLKFDIEPVDHGKRVIEAREMRFRDNDRATVESILAIYEENKGKVENGTDDEQIMLLSTMHAQREFMGWFLGEALMIIDEKIKSGKKTTVLSLNEWLDVNEGRLGFGKKTAYKYVTVRQASTLEQFKRLGVSKTLAVAQIKDEKKREEAIKKVTEAKMTVEAVKSYVEELAEKERDKLRKAVEKSKTEAKKEIPISFKPDKNGISIQTSPEYAELLRDFLGSPSEIERLKIALYRLRDQI